MESINNHFHMLDGYRQIIADWGEFGIENGIIEPVGNIYLVGQYIRIAGSVFNNGAYKIEYVGNGYIDVSIHDENYPPWIIPVDTLGLYRVGDRVTHNGIRFVSLVNNNSWEPGIDERLWETVGEAEHTVRDEIFTGAVAPLAIPPAFLAIVKDISAFNMATQQNIGRGALTSESIGSYSYSMATTSNGVAASWKEAFASRLNPYRKMFPEKIL